MNEFSQFAEHTVKKKQGKHHKTVKAVYSLLIALMVLIVNIILAYMVLGLLLGGILLAITLPLSVLYSNRLFASISYDYCITEGEMYFSVVYNNRKRKELGSVEISKLEAIAPYKDTYKASADRITYIKELNMTSSPDSDGIYYAVLSDPEDHSAKTIYFFEPSDKMLKLLKFYNRNTVIPKAKAE